jgi:uncharacterized protein YukE
MNAVLVEPEALLAHSKGSTAAGEHFAGLARILEQARVSDDCFGPLGELLAFSYFNSLQECQDLANQVNNYFKEISTAVSDTAKAYADQDTHSAGTYQGMADGGSGPGTIGDVNNAGAADKKGYWGQTAGYGSSWVDASQKLADAGSPAEITYATVNARMEQLKAVASPGQAFFDNGLGFLISIVISPLVNFVLEPAIGDPEQMRSTAKGWEKVAGWVDGVGTHENARAKATEPVWQGDAGDAFRTEMAEFGDGAQAFANDIRGLQQTLELAADLFDMFVQIVIDIIQELVIGLIIEWLAALAASWITAGASVAAATGMTSAQVAITGTRLGTKVANLLHKLKPLITKLEDLLRYLRKGPLRKVVDKLHDARDMPFVGRQITKNPITNALSSHTDDALRATRSAHNVFGKAAVGEQALAQHVVKGGLGLAGLGGTTDVGRAVQNAALENVPGTVIEQGMKYGENKAQDPSSEEERRAAEERGFTVD